MSEFVKRIETEDGVKKQIDFQALGNFPRATVGQVLRVTAVDESGRPTAWEAVTPFTYDTEDLVAGESELETGKIYFVYE